MISSHLGRFKKQKHASQRNHAGVKPHREILQIGRRLDLFRRDHMGRLTAEQSKAAAAAEGLELVTADSGFLEPPSALSLYSPGNARGAPDAAGKIY